MGKYILIMSGGEKSAMPLTKQHAVRAVNNWFKKDGWTWLEVKNVETDESVAFIEGEQNQITSEDINV